jgi:sec-independent protein translocase protein TatB
MSLPDTIFIFALALVIFGPKKLPQIGRQLGKLVLEFRRASNEFKMQIEEELRTAEEQERQKQLAAQASTPASKLAGEPGAAATSASVPAPAVVTSSEAPSSPTIRPPSTGTQVSAESPSQAFSVEESPAAHEQELSHEQSSVTVASHEGFEERTTNHHG